MPKNEHCVVTDSEICRWIGKDCKDCYIKDIKDDSDALKTLSDFKVTISLLPESFDSLQSEECRFCKGEPRKREGYANIDIAHSEPESKRGMFFGIGKKVRQRIGSLLPLSISICGECRRTLRMAEAIKWMSILLLGAAALGICFIPAVNENPIMPYVVVLVGILIGYVAGKIISSAYVNKKSAVTRFNVFDIPVCKEMRDGGWFTVQDEGAVSRFIFTKKPLIKRFADVGIALEKKDNT